MRIVLFLLALILAGPAFGQGAVLQGGPPVLGHAPVYASRGTSQAVVQDSGTAGGSGPGLSELNVIARGTGTPPYAGLGTGPYGTNICDYDAPITNPTGYHYLCFSANAQGGALIATGAVGSAASQSLLLNINGTTYDLGAIAINVNGGSPLNKWYYVSTVGNDANNGFTFAAPKLNLQAAVNAANPGGIVVIGSGTYTLSSNLLMKPGVGLWCPEGATITQANNANLTLMIDFNTNAANGGSITNCTILGNAANNSLSLSFFNVYIGAASDVVLSNNTIGDSPGYLVDVTTGVRANIHDNKFGSFYAAGVTVAPLIPLTRNYAKVTDNWFSGNMGQHVIFLGNSDFNEITNNHIVSSGQIGMTVNTSGSTVTLVSGPGFSSLSPGQFITIAGGNEYFIPGPIASSTSVTVTPAPGTQTGVAAAAGPGDLISVNNSSYNTIVGNELIGGGAGGIVVSNFIGGEDTQKNIVSDNIIVLPVQSCISVSGADTSGLGVATHVFDNKVTNNIVGDCGRGGAAIAAATQSGISVLDFGSAIVGTTQVTNNLIRDDQNSPTMAYGIALSGVVPGSVFAGHNTIIGTTNPGILRAVTSVTLGSGWGSTATADGIISYGDSVYMLIHSSGSGQDASPGVAINTAATSPDNPALPLCKMVAGSGTVQALAGENTSTASAISFNYSGTPGAGQTYGILCRL